MRKTETVRNRERILLSIGSRVRDGKKKKKKKRQAYRDTQYNRQTDRQVAVQITGT